MAVLAGGDGSRIGGRKPERILDGTSLIERALTLAKKWSADAVAVGRDPAQTGTAAIPLLQDAPGAQGPIAGLAAALHHGCRERHAFVLTIPCDTPFLPADLADRLRTGLGPQLNAAVAASGGVLHPSCAVWRARAFGLLGAYLASGRSSLRGFAAEIGFAQVDWSVEDGDPFFNVNTMADLAAAEARASAKDPAR